MSGRGAGLLALDDLPVQLGKLELVEPAVQPAAQPAAGGTARARRYAGAAWRA